MTHVEHRGLNGRGYVVNGCRECEGSDFTARELLRVVPAGIVGTIIIAAFLILLFSSGSA